MRCPFCPDKNTQVKDSRPTEDNSSIRRRRLCGSCGARFTTFERVQLRELTVLKGNDERQVFDREKITRSIVIATRKRNVDHQKIELSVSDIVRKLESSGETEITSSKIGHLVMDELKELDNVAYIRYASVYKSFDEAGDFKEFIEHSE